MRREMLVHGPLDLDSVDLLSEQSISKFSGGLLNQAHAFKCVYVCVRCGDNSAV